jgi:hypothetical protein
MMAGLLLLMGLLILLLIWRLLTATVAIVVILLQRRVTRKQDWDILLRNIGSIHIRQPHKVVAVFFFVVFLVFADYLSVSGFFFTGSKKRTAEWRSKHSRARTRMTLCGMRIMGTSRTMNSGLYEHLALLC